MAVSFTPALSPVSEGELDRAARDFKVRILSAVRLDARGFWPTIGRSALCDRSLGRATISVPRDVRHISRATFDR